MVAASKKLAVPQSSGDCGTASSSGLTETAAGCHRRRFLAGAGLPPSRAVVLADFISRRRRHGGADRDEGISLPVDSSTAASPPVGSPEPRRPGSRAVLTLVNGVLAGVGGVFVATHACPST